MQNCLEMRSELYETVSASVGNRGVTSLSDRENVRNNKENDNPKRNIC